MSTDYRTAEKISAHELFDGRLEAYGVREHINPDETSEKRRCLTDGRNYMWVYIDDDGFVGSVTRYAPGGAPGKILKAIAEAFDTDVVSEYEPQYWGFETQEEWDACWDEMAKKDRQAFYGEVLKYLAGEPHDLRPGTIGMIKAKIAREIVEKNPALLSPTNENTLLGEIDAIYDREHVVKVTLTPEQIAPVRLSATHEDDLPRA